MAKNIEHHLYLKILTPVHIGGTAEKHLQEGFDYIKKDNKIYRLYTEKLLKSDSGFKPTVLAQAFMKGNADAIKTMLGNRFNDFAVEFKGEAGSTGEIKAFIKDGLFNKPYIPGSSLKGAIRSTVLSQWLKPDTDKRFADDNLIGKFENSWFRHLQVHDVQFESTDFIPTKLYNLGKDSDEWQGKWKKRGGFNGFSEAKFSKTGFDTAYECVIPDTIAKLSINTDKAIPDRLPDSQNADKKVFFTDEKSEKLLITINDSTLIHLEKELKFFQKYDQAENSEKIIESIEELIHLAKSFNGNKAILRLGSGSGFHAMTGDIFYPDHINTGFNNGRIKYKSRRIAFYNGIFAPMGFVLLSKEPLTANTSKKETSNPKKIIMNTPTAPKAETVPVPFVPKMLSAGDIKDSSTEVYAEVVDFQNKKVKVKLWIEEYKDKTFEFSYFAGIPVGSGVIVKLRFERKKIQDGFGVVFSNVIKN